MLCYNLIQYRIVYSLICCIVVELHEFNVIAPVDAIDTAFKKLRRFCLITIGYCLINFTSDSYYL